MGDDLALETACNEFIQHVETTLVQILRAIYQELFYIFCLQIFNFKIFTAMGVEQERRERLLVMMGFEEIIVMKGR